MPGGDIEKYNAFEKANTVRDTLGSASTMQSIDQLLMRLKTETRLRMAGDGHGRCAPLPLCAR